MKSLIILSGLALSLGLACSVSNNKATQVKASDPTPADADLTVFNLTETSYSAAFEGTPVDIPGFSFDGDTKTYTFENVNLIVNAFNSQIRYDNIEDGEDATINFVIKGENNITFVGGDDSHISGFQFGYGGTYNFTGTGSLTIDSKLTALDSQDNEFSSSGITNYGTLIINEGVTLNCYGGNGHYGSYGICNNGFIYNRNGNIGAYSGKSSPESYEFGDNGFGIGFLNEFMYDQGETRYPGIYEQTGKNAKLTAISNGNSYCSFGVHSTAADDSDGKSLFKVSGGTVKAVAQNCYDYDNATSIGFRTTSECVLECTDCVIDAINECEKVNPLNVGAGSYLDPKYLPLELLNNEKDIKLSGTAIVNCTSPNVELSTCTWFEDPLDDLYVLPEGNEQIFAWGLESKYPDDVAFANEFEQYYEEGEEKGIETANFVLRPQDGTVTLVNKKEYFNVYKNALVEEITNYKDQTKYGTEYCQVASTAKDNINNFAYNTKVLYSENKVVVDAYKAAFIRDAAPIITFVDTQLEALDHVTNAVDATKKAEQQLATEYSAKLVDVSYDKTKPDAALTKVNSLLAEFDAKLADLRKKGLSAGAIIGIVAGSLVLVYGVGFALWKTSAISFMSKPFFGKAYNWLNKLISKILKKKNK